MAKHLADLLRALPDLDPSQPLPAATVNLVTADSRRVGPGTLFVAIHGGTVDGHRFIPDALARGAAAVVGTEHAPGWPAGSETPYVRVSDSRLALGTLAAALHGFPGRRLALVGVTGTDGKTTTTNLIYRMLEHAGLRPGMVSTVGASIAGETLDTGFHVTTPDAPDVQHFLARMVDAGCNTAVLEATSHGLHQGRLAGCDFDVAVVTNVTHEHLDYHGTWDAYLDAKATLFRMLAASARKTLALYGEPRPQPKVAVLNRDDKSYEPLQTIPADLQLSYGIDNVRVDLCAEEIDIAPGGARFLVKTPAGETRVETPLVGRFNVYNSLAAIGAGLALGVSLDACAAGLAAMAGVDGRMERINRGQDFLALVDFAHTPVSLARALETVRPMARGRVIAVFGSAGLRDVDKRYLMAETSVRLADLTILTAEDPRTESLDMILEQMAQGAVRAGGQEGRDFLRIPDRTSAIRTAVEMARPGDVVIVCGKGHERSMCFGVVEHPWRDQDVLAWALELALGSSRAAAPYWLPTAEGGEESEPC